MSSHIAVFDIGKTNKKLLIYDENLKLIETVREQFPEYSEGDILFERVGEMTEWYLNRLADLSSSYTIRAVSVATQGATGICVNTRGESREPAVPPVAYTTEPGEDFHRKFVKRFGGAEKIQRTTATVPMSNLLNMAQLAVFLRDRYPEEFESADALLGFPQYFGYVLTGKTGAEPTYMGCHSLLWEHGAGRWSYIAEGLGLLEKLPPGLHHSWDVLGTVTPEIAERTGLSTDTIVTYGIHDSNASLLPYLIRIDGDFLLNSTGTWCALMRPAKKLGFEPEEIGKMVYYNLDVHSRPVKTSILLGGLEFETWSGLLKEINGEESYPEFDPKRYRNIIAAQNKFIFPSIVPGTGQFPDSQPRVCDNGRVYTLDEVRKGKYPEFFSDFPEAMAVLNISVAIQTSVAMKRVGFTDGMPIYTEGGFHNNPDYNALITSIYRNSKVYLSNLDEATAFGAALLARAALDGRDPLELGDYFEIETRPVAPVDLGDIDAYIASFMELL